VLLHTAAMVSSRGSIDAFRRVNVDGVRDTARIARDAGVQRFIHLSSVMVYGFRYPPNVSEEGPFRGEGNAYCQTKIEGEEAAMSAHERGGMGVVVIRPGDVYGPGSPQWVVRPIEGIKKNRFPLIDGGRGVINHLYVDNLLDAVFLALDKDATGEAFNITDGQSTTWAAYFNRLAAMAGRGPLPSIPSWLVRPCAAMLTGVSSILGRESPVDAGAIEFVTRRHPYSIDKARRVLGYEPRVSLDAGMDRVREWLEQEGII